MGETITLDTKAYVDDRFAALEKLTVEVEKRYCLKIENIGKDLEHLEEVYRINHQALIGVIDKADEVNEARLHSLNEWREQNRTETAKHATKEDVDASFKFIRAEYDGRIKVMEALFIAVILAIISGYLLHIGLGG